MRGRGYIFDELLDAFVAGEVVTDQLELLDLREDVEVELPFIPVDQIVLRTASGLRPRRMNVTAARRTKKKKKKAKAHLNVGIAVLDERQVHQINTPEQQ